MPVTTSPSALESAANAPASFPPLFGTSETRSDNISAFRKWTDALRRYESGFTSVSASPVASGWIASLQQFRSLPIAEKAEEVNRYMNRIPYVEDWDNWGRSDYWAAPSEFLARGGDCEDFAIAKYASMKMLGVPADQLRVAIVHDMVLNIPHAVAIVYTPDMALVLDNQVQSVTDAAHNDRYLPFYSINEKSWWLHRTASA